jgi:hypothetical protein
MIRHCVEESNVDGDMNVIDPERIRHVTVRGGKIVLMSGLIDPLSHLNLDFADHRVTVCIIAEKFEIGAAVKMNSEGLIFANVAKSCYRSYGYIDYTQRLADMIKAVKRNQQNRDSKHAALRSRQEV